MSNVDCTKIVTTSVAPVVIISACSLLCLAFYNRLAAIVSRLRGFQRERLREQELILRAEPQDGPELIRRRKMLEHLESQSARVTRRAKLIRTTLFFLLLTIALLISCCMMLGVSVLIAPAIYLADVLFMFGLISMFTGIVAAMLELKASLQPAELESQFVSNFLDDERIRLEDRV
jgi:predicted phage tail protein